MSTTTTDTSPPIKIDGHRRLSVSLVVAIALGGALISTTLAWAAITNRVSNTEELARDNAGRLTRVERRMDTDLAEIKTNLLWLKEREQARASALK